MLGEEPLCIPPSPYLHLCLEILHPPWWCGWLSVLPLRASPPFISVCHFLSTTEGHCSNNYPLYPLSSIFFFSLNSGSFPLTIKHTSCDKENSQNNSLDPTFFPGTLLTHPISLLPFMENSWKILFFCYSNRDPPTTSVSPRNLKEIQTHMFHSYLLNQKFYFSSISRIYNNIKIGAALVCSDDF